MSGPTQPVNVNREPLPAQQQSDGMVLQGDGSFNSNMSVTRNPNFKSGINQPTTSELMGRAQGVPDRGHYRQQFSDAYVSQGQAPDHVAPGARDYGQPVVSVAVPHLGTNGVPHTDTVDVHSPDGGIGQQEINTAINVATTVAHDNVDTHFTMK